MVNNYSEYLPYSEIEIAIIVDDDNNDNNYLPCEVKGVVAVSYTHLDVYKRQELASASEQGCYVSV